MTAPRHSRDTVAVGVPELFLVARLHVDLLRVASARCRSVR
ncbi:putative leader peptide [Pseudofrankia sp. DC12]|nr:putative leader peptide [Pseudofrankia sp. DC12]